MTIISNLFKSFGKFTSGGSKKAVKPAIETAIPEVPKSDVSGEVNAAIAMALFMYSNELHDQENPVITMIKVSRTYSPWSSHIYGLRKSPR